MWGSRTGWLIAAGIAVVFGWVLVMGAMPAPMEDPTGAFADVGLKVAALPIDPVPALFKPGTGEGDAAPLYREAMHDFDEHPDDYANWQKNPTTVPVDHPPVGVQKILAARDCSKMDLFAKDPKELINYENNTPGIVAIDAVAHVMDNIANLAATKDKAKGREYGEALFALGYNLFRERVRWVECNEGATIMGWAALDLANAEPDHAQEYKDFSDAARKYQDEKIGPLYAKLSAIEPLGYSGDIYQLAQANNPERMWRIEAILRLGRLTHKAPTRGDQLVARHFLANLVADPNQDPLIHAAADESNDIVTNEAKFNRIGLSTDGG